MTSGKTPPTDWLETANQFQQNLIQQWTQVAQAFPGAAAAPKAGANDPFAAFKAFMPQAGAANPFGMAMPTAGAAFPGMPAMPAMPGMGDMFKNASGQQVSFDPAKLLEIQNQYLKDVTGLWNQGPTVKPEGDRRFASDAWASNPMAAFAAAAYLLNARTLMSLADAVQGDAKTRSRVRFAVQHSASSTCASVWSYGRHTRPFITRYRARKPLMPVLAETPAARGKALISLGGSGSVSTSCAVSASTS
eukprot:gene17830-36474_t